MSHGTGQIEYNCNLSNKESEITVNSGSVPGIPRNLYAWKTTNSKKKGRLFSAHVAQSQGMEELFLERGKLV